MDQYRVSLVVDFLEEGGGRSSRKDGGKGTRAEPASPSFSCSSASLKQMGDNDGKLS